MDSNTSDVCQRTPLSKHASMFIPNSQGQSRSANSGAEHVDVGSRFDSREGCWRYWKPFVTVDEGSLCFTLGPDDPLSSPSVPQQRCGDPEPGDGAEEAPASRKHKLVNKKLPRSKGEVERKAELEQRAQQGAAGSVKEEKTSSLLQSSRQRIHGHTVHLAQRNESVILNSLESTAQKENEVLPCAAACARPLKILPDGRCERSREC